MLAVYSYYGGFAVFVLRIAVAAVFIAHGWMKLKDMKKAKEGMAGMGFRPGWLFATLAMILEFFGGIALLFGFLVQIVAFFAILEFIVIIFWKISKHMPLIGGWELELLILVAAVVLFYLGGGSYALDHVLFL